MRYTNKGFNFDNFEITKREILASISIFAILLVIGILISNKITEAQLDRNEVYNKAIKITSDTELFQYGIDTNVGNAFVYGDYIVEDPVTYPEIGGEYSYIEKKEEHYNQHTKQVSHTRTKSNGKTETYYTTETYWSWDYYGSEDKTSTLVNFCGIQFNLSEIGKLNDNHIDTLDGGYHIRYVYYGSPIQSAGTIYATLSYDGISNTSYYDKLDIDTTVKHLESNGGVILFWVFWIIVMDGCIFGFYYLDNNWLEN